LKFIAFGDIEAKFWIC